MEENTFASSDYMSLLPYKNKATFRKMFKLLFFALSFNNSDLLDHNISEEKENRFLHRLMILISILIQIVLKHISKPMKKFGTIIQDFLNRGVTQRDSHEYISFIGHSDTRLDLDKDIKRGDARYYPALSMMASKLAYENKAVINVAVTNHWKMEFVGFYDFYNDLEDKLRTQAYIFREENTDGDVIFVVFRGTSPFVADDWRTDVDFSWVKIDGMGKTHLGFMIALGLSRYSHEGHDYLEDFSGSWPKKIEQDPKHPLAYYTIREKLKEMMKGNKNAKVIVTGHSLGSALAILFPSVLALHGEVELLDRLEAIYTFGQPRVGDEEFGQFMKKNLREHNVKYYRIVYGYDIVPKIPFDNTMMTFKHFGRSIHFNSLYHAKIIEEEKQSPIFLRVMKTIINLVVSRLVAVWELIRGLIIGYAKGPDYREGWLLICIRIIGILFPSIVNHCPQDYVNSTRLGSEEFFRNYPALP